ncbi:DUF3055 domain-containing protein [Brevibacillus humidisoli]|uniref:DUF3055 domain-containing protein n=1 Tax=Brevibacillus humidisoli TaxID=2895522 RepID=UPI001E545E0D|nr:DUF3055 domain-containing protein [Brevibacillus humidisoli]UFJ41860.1 DUF3055 domain-containing protein [Brevibacillus humidisoli]
MDRFDNLYDLSETANVRFMGFVSEMTRYDFGIVFTHRFYGKPLVICMQTGQSTLLSSEDVGNPSFLQKAFRLPCLEEAQQLSEYLQDHLPPMPFEENQY